MKCTHREDLGQPKRGIIVGVCRLCGNRREYPAVLPESGWGHQDMVFQRQYQQASLLAAHKARRKERAQSLEWQEYE